MPISVTAAAVATDLCVVEDFNDDIRGASNVNDVRLAELIRRASAAIPRYLGYILAQQTYQEDVPGYGDTILELFQSPTPADGLPPGGPLTTVTSVNLLDTENGSSPTAVTDFLIADAMAGHLYRRTGWQWTAQVRTNLTDHVFDNSERPLYRVVYISGWTTPRAGTTGTTIEGTLPFDIRHACIETVQAWWFREQRDQSVTLRRMGDITLEYVQPSPLNPFGFPDTALALLDRLRKVA